jgi:hypothetical protein
MRVRTVRCRPIGSSIVPPPVGLPERTAPGIRADLAPLQHRATSAYALSGVRATTSRPLVSLSSRCTSPARGTRASDGSCASSAFCSVCAAVAGAGMHHQPGRLVEHQQPRPRARYPAPSARRDVGRAVNCASTAPAPRPAPGRVARTAAVDLHRARRIQRWSRAREYCGSAAASAWSKRSPAAAAGAVRSW